ncbi:MAG: hypothetical protein ACRCYM_04460 [Cetobacterium sp.]
MNNLKDPLFDQKTGRGKFNLEKSLRSSPPKSSGKHKLIFFTSPVPGEDESPVLPRVKLVGRLQKDAMGNDVRVFVPVKKRKRGK